MVVFHSHVTLPQGKFKYVCTWLVKLWSAKISIFFCWLAGEFCKQLKRIKRPIQLVEDEYIMNHPDPKL